MTRTVAVAIICSFREKYGFLLAQTGTRASIAVQSSDIGMGGMGWDEMGRDELGW